MAMATNNATPVAAEGAQGQHRLTRRSTLTEVSKWAEVNGGDPAAVVGVILALPEMPAWAVSRKIEEDDPGRFMVSFKGAAEGVEIVNQDRAVYENCTIDMYLEQVLTIANDKIDHDSGIGFYVGNVPMFTSPEDAIKLGEAIAAAGRKFAEHIR